MRALGIVTALIGIKLPSRNSVNICNLIPLIGRVGKLVRQVPSL